MYESVFARYPKWFVLQQAWQLDAGPGKSKGFQSGESCNQARRKKWTQWSGVGCWFCGRSRSDCITSWVNAPAGGQMARLGRAFPKLTTRSEAAGSRNAASCFGDRV